MTMNNDIKKAISENLPQTVGEELRKRLDQADADALRVKELKVSKQELERKNTAKDERIRAYENQEITIKNLEADVIKREKEMTKLELVAQYEEEKRVLTVSLFQTVFANRIVRENAIVQRPFSSTRDQYGNIQTQEGYEDRPESKETEEG